MSNRQVLDLGFVNDQSLLSFRPLFSEPVWNDRSDETRPFFQPLVFDTHTDGDYRAPRADMGPAHEDLPFAFAANSSRRGFSGFKDYNGIQRSAREINTNPFDFDVRENAFSFCGEQGNAGPNHEVLDVETDAAWNDKQTEAVYVIKTSGRSNTELLM
jgi:hypothetical protein